MGPWRFVSNKPHCILFFFLSSIYKSRYIIYRGFFPYGLISVGWLLRHDEKTTVGNWTEWGNMTLSCHKLRESCLLFFLISPLPQTNTIHEKECRMRQSSRNVEGYFKKNA